MMGMGFSEGMVSVDGTEFMNKVQIKAVAIIEAAFQAFNKSVLSLRVETAIHPESFQLHEISLNNCRLKN
jgi:hypothetical protein